ncbi:MAG: adenosylcobinamide-GDP ribazoletransferase [Rhodobacterales bacterium]|nr:MAG: adenosylcobinamide-GDP ribazoletransferase [Rhodobacterales bacterium]
MLTQFRCALGFLTRLPGGGPGTLAAAAPAFPLVGLVIGACQAMAATLALWAGLPPAIAAGLALAAGVLATGGLHEDGLADSADGLWGGGATARRLEIMRDSRIGSYGVLALILSLGLQGAALTALLEAGAVWAPLLAAGAISRAAMAVVMEALLPARTDGLSKGAGQPGGSGAVTSLAIGAGLTLILTGAGVVPILIAGAAAVFWLCNEARARIGGQTGDILGATQQLTQITALCVLAARV